MKHFAIFCLFLISINAFSQDAGKAFKMEVPGITMGENQNFQAISFEPLAQDKFAILYVQELPATISGTREFRSDKYPGAFLDVEAKKPVNYSDRVVFLVRQTFSKTATLSTDYWVIAIRELQSDMGYTMYFPKNFVHPFVANASPVTYSLKNLEQVKGLSTREFEALVLLGKQKYGFYKYPEPTYSAKPASITDELALMKSGFKELKAVTGRGDIPKTEKLLFKRDVVGKIRLAATKIDKKDSVQVKLYLATNDEANYELLKTQTFSGTISPNFASALIYDESLKVGGAYGYVLLKYKDATGASKANPLALGINENGDPQFWRLEAGKNVLNSFNPWFSYSNEQGLYAISTNSEKAFKPYYQHHLFKKDGSTVLLYPTTPAEIGSEKFQFVHTEQVKNAGYTTTDFSTMGKTEFPVGFYEVNKTRYILTGSKTTVNNGSSMVTTFGNIAAVRIDADNKIKQNYDLTENKSTAIVMPRLLGQYNDKIHLLINYPNKFELILSEDKLETEALENNVYRMVYMANEDCVSANQFGSMFLTKTVVGNKYSLEFFPAK